MSPAFWNDAKMRRLTDNSRFVFLFLMTNPSLTALGAMRATVPGLAAELGWNETKFLEAFDPLVEMGRVIYDPGSCFVALPNFLTYNPPESPNVVRGWAKALETLPECPGRDETVKRAGRCAQDADQGKTKGFSKAFGEAFGEALAKGFEECSNKAFVKDFRQPIANQEQEQEQEQEEEKRQAEDSLTPGSAQDPQGSEPAPKLEVRDLTPQQARVRTIEEHFSAFEVPAPKPGLIAKWLKTLEGPDRLLALLRNMGKVGLAKGPGYITGAVNKEAKRDRGGLVRPGGSPGAPSGSSPISPERAEQVDAITRQAEEEARQGREAYDPNQGLAQGGLP